MTHADEKAVLRSALRTRRRAVEDREGAALRAAGLLETSARTWPATAAVYLAHGSEIDAAPVARVLADRGVTLCLPMVEGPDRPLTFRRWAPGDAMAVDTLGLPVPAKTEISVPDWVVTPLLGFDRAGRRLGQGGGYYDRTLETLRRDGRVLAVGLAFAEQEVESLADEDHDQRLDAVLTDREWIVVSAGLS